MNCTPQKSTYYFAMLFDVAEYDLCLEAIVNLADLICRRVCYQALISIFSRFVVVQGHDKHWCKGGAGCRANPGVHGEATRHFVGGTLRRFAAESIRIDAEPA